MATNYGDRVTDGMDVYDVSGEKIGTVEDVYDTTQAKGRSSSGGGYLRVPTGFLGLGREHHIPFSAIRSIKGDQIHLRASKDELDELGYGESPTSADDEQAEYVDGERDIGSPASSTAAAHRSSEQQRLQLREEELIPRKRTVQTGEVRLQTDVVEERRTVEVPVTREEVYLERRPIERRPSDRPISEKGETIEVPVMEEDVTVEKRPVVYEEVEVGTRAIQETESVDATVRREELRIEDKNNVLEESGRTTASSSLTRTTASTSTNAGWPAVKSGYRSRWQQRYGNQGGRWEDVEPAYQYGYGLREQPQYRGRSWSDIEPDVQRDWTRTHPTTPWERARLGIRDAWDNATDR